MLSDSSHCSLRMTSASECRKGYLMIIELLHFIKVAATLNNQMITPFQFSDSLFLLFIGDNSMLN